MNEVIIHCPGCGAALSVAPRVSQAHVSGTYSTIQVHFAVANVDHECNGGDR